MWEPGKDSGGSLWRYFLDISSFIVWFVQLSTSLLKWPILACARDYSMISHRFFFWRGRTVRCCHSKLVTSRRDFTHLIVVLLNSQITLLLMCLYTTSLIWKLLKKSAEPRELIRWNVKHNTWQSLFEVYLVEILHPSRLIPVHVSCVGGFQPYRCIDACSAEWRGR